MGYLHIENLYRPAAQRILAFKEVFALEKIHGTSAHVAWDGTAVRFFSGGAKHSLFASLFDPAPLEALLQSAFGGNRAIVYGEAYGGSQQGMKATYGDALRFIAFDVRVGDTWLAVPQAVDVTEKLGLEFVPYRFVATDLSAIDGERDRPSEVAARRGISEPRPREGVVLRPPFEVTLNNGARLIAKHKRAEFGETKTPRVVSPEDLKVWTDAEAVAEEWVTEMRLTHVLDKIGNPTELNRTGDVVRAMQEDVLREGRGEIANPEQAMKAIGKRAATMFKARVTAVRR